MCLCKSGRDRLEALAGGAQDAEALAERARGRLRAKLPQVRQALDGRVQPHHRFLLQQLLAHLDFLEESLAQVQQELEQRLGPFEEAMTLVEGVTGIQATAAAAILAAIGVDPSRFESRQAPGLVGWRLPWQQAERRQTAQWQAQERHPLSACGPG